MKLWALRIRRPLTAEETERLLPVLPLERRVRLLRRKNQERNTEVLCAYELLRCALEQCYGWKALPMISCTENGKPWFPGEPAVQFNISHTEGAVLIALSERPVGVDIQKIRPVREGLLRRLKVESHQDFFPKWTALEASVKCSGVGLVKASEVRDKELKIFPLEIFPGYAACAAGGLEEEVRSVFQMELEDLLRDRV